MLIDVYAIKQYMQFNRGGGDYQREIPLQLSVGDFGSVISTPNTSKEQLQKTQMVFSSATKLLQASYLRKEGGRGTWSWDLFLHSLEILQLCWVWDILLLHGENWSILVVSFYTDLLSIPKASKGSYLLSLTNLGHSGIPVPPPSTIPYGTMPWSCVLSGPFMNTWLWIC